MRGEENKCKVSRKGRMNDRTRSERRHTIGEGAVQMVSKVALVAQALRCKLNGGERKLQVYGLSPS